MLARILFCLCLIFSMTPVVSSPIALALGIVLAVTVGNPFLDLTKKYTHKLLSWSVIGLGAGMNLIVVGNVGIHGIGYTVLGISLTLFLGYVFNKYIKADEEASILITVGTAICGGSAIAAIAPTIKAKSHSISIALGTVFLLNACALIIFPIIGHHFNLSQTQFGLWSALAIHDTSSVVGATLQYGAEALQIGTTVKLARALWIVPLALLSTYLFSKKENSNSTDQTKKPWFILGFIFMAAIMTWIPDLKPAGHIIELVAKKGLVVTLFLIGSNLTLATLKSVGVRPFLLGLLLWISIASITLISILNGLIR